MECNESTQGGLTNDSFQGTIQIQVRCNGSAEGGRRVEETAYDLHSLRSITRMIELRRMRLAGHVA
jgi:hypothetical protein